MKSFTKTIFIIFLIAVFVFSINLSAKDKVIEAAYSVESWLKIVDSGKYAKSWSLTAKIFKDQMNKEKWIDTLHKVRKPLGKCISRERAVLEYLTEIQGAPDGEYVLIRNRTEFENMKNAIETVTVVLENKKWKVIGYYIQAE